MNRHLSVCGRPSAEKVIAEELGPYLARLDEARTLA